MTTLRDYASTVAQPTLGDAPARYDEVVAPDGTLRPAWHALAGSALGLTEADLRRADRDIARILLDDGVTDAGPAGDRTDGSGTRWTLDPIPLVLDAAQWSRLEVGLAQRTELLNAVLVDLYGEATLLSRGIVPPAVVYGHPGYLRAVARASAQDERPLLVAAADLGRTPAGEWQVVADRAQAPSGIGYALENRHAVSRALPGLHRGVGLHRAAPFLHALRAGLVQAAPSGVVDPRVVVLSPGPGSETAYDQAFIASGLGLPLVQGSDLVVRGGRVWLRVHDRLERVDVVLRRVDAAWSDPLELRGDSELGVAGLLEAARRGTVRVVNGLGAGLLENPGLLPFLPAACEALLGEPLRLPSVATTWLGDDDARAHARAALDDVVVRSIDGATSWDGEQARTRWAAVEAAPHRFVAQERMTLSQAPQLGRRGVTPEAVLLRTFTLHHGAACRPFVGGLATVVRDGRATASKDVWVLKADPDEPDQGLEDDQPVVGLASTPAFVPRVLEGLYWFGRYAERAEDTVRLTLVVQGLADDFRARSGGAGGPGLDALHAALDGLGPARRPSGLDDDLRSLLLDTDREGSVARSVADLRRAALGVRDQLSPDTWRAFGAIDRATEALRGGSGRVGEGAEQVLTGLLALHGVTASMVRDPGWRALEVGRSVERALQLCLLVRGTLTAVPSPEVERQVAAAVLVATESAVTHRRRHRGAVRLGGVLELLLLDADNPRSLAFALARTGRHLAGLPLSTGSTRPERLLEDLATEVGRLDAAALADGTEGRRGDLEQHLDDVVAQLGRFGDAFAALHLASGPPPRAFGLVVRP